MVGKINWEILSLTRFLLAFIVMVDHLQGFTAIGFFKWYTYFGSFEAILGFLLISGLSIGKSISKNKTNYFKRRIQRIYPVYIASLAFQAVVAGVVPGIYSIGILLLNLLFLNQVFTGVSFVGPAWTLAVEVWLYSLAPFFLKLKRNTLYIIIFFSFFCYAVYTCGRTLFHWNYYSGTMYGINLVILAFIWIAGFVCAIFPGSFKRNAIIVALLLGGHLALDIGIQILFRIKNHRTDEIINSDIAFFIGKTCCLILVYFVVIFNYKIALFKPLINKFFNLLGNISYPLYLSHLTTFFLLTKFHINNALLMTLSALTVAYLIYYVFDFYSKKRVVSQ